MTHLRSFPPDAPAHIGGYVVAAWLAGIIVNLVMMSVYLDVELGRA